jgi:hypothetical protein
MEAFVAKHEPANEQLRRLQAKSLEAPRDVIRGT